MTETFHPSTDKYDWLFTLAEEITDRYAFKKCKEAIARAERLKAGTWTPDWQTVETCLSLANQWITYIAPNNASAYQYKTREVGNTYQIYQEIDGGEHDA